jgi:hypothetical protein
VLLVLGPLVSGPGSGPLVPVPWSVLSYDCALDLWGPFQSQNLSNNRHNYKLFDTDLNAFMVHVGPHFGAVWSSKSVMVIVIVIVMFIVIV